MEDALDVLVSLELADQLERDDPVAAVPSSVVPLPSSWSPSVDQVELDVVAVRDVGGVG